MHGRRTHPGAYDRSRGTLPVPSLLLTAAGVLLFLAGARAQTNQDTIAAEKLADNRDTKILQLSGEPSVPASRQEVTAEELKSLRPAATLIDEGIDPEGEPLSAANRPRSTTIYRDADRPIGRPTEPEGPGAAVAGDTQIVVNDRGKAAAGWFSLKDFTPLAVVLVLIFGLAWIIKRYKPARAMLGGGGILEVVARLPVSSKQTLLLVRMGRQLVLLGQSQDRLTMLTEVSDPEEVSTLIGEAVSRTNHSLSHEFAETFESESALYERDLDPDPAERARGHVRLLLDRVRQLTRSREVA